MFSQLEIYERAWRKSGVRMPIKQPLEKLLDLILLTEENRKQYVRLGSSFWTIKEHYKKKYYDVVGVFPILPCVKRGYWYYKDMPLQPEIMVVHALEDRNKEDWARGYKSVIDWGIKQKNLYYNPNCPKVKWRYSKTRLAR